jgi:hypothetical protein
MTHVAAGVTAFTTRRQVSQPDGTFVVGAHRLASLYQLPLILKRMRYEVRTDQLVIKFTYTII